MTEITQFEDFEKVFDILLRKNLSQPLTLCKAAKLEMLCYLEESSFGQKFNVSFWGQSMIMLL